MKLRYNYRGNEYPLKVGQEPLVSKFKGKSAPAQNLPVTHANVFMTDNDGVESSFSFDIDGLNNLYRRMQRTLPKLEARKNGDGYDETTRDMEVLADLINEVKINCLMDSDREVLKISSRKVTFGSGGDPQLVH